MTFATINTSLSHADYAKLPGLSATAIKAGRLSMRAMRQSIAGKPRSDTPSLAFGRIIHAAVLEPEKMLSRCVAWEGGAKRGKEWTEFLEENASKEIVTVEQRERLEDIVLAVHRKPAAQRLINETIHEASVFWTDELLGECKCRPDGLSINCGLIEVKSTSVIETRRFIASQFYGMGYDIQVGWYVDGCGRLELYDPEMPVNMIVIDTSAVCDVFVLPIPADVVRDGMKAAREIAAMYRACSAVKCWPGVDKGVDKVEFVKPRWMENEGTAPVPTETMEVSEL